METENEETSDLISEIKIEEEEIHVDFIKTEERDFDSSESMTGTDAEVNPIADLDLIEEFGKIEQNSWIKQEPTAQEFEIIEIKEKVVPEPEQSESPARKFLCIYCNKKFLNKQTLQRHVRIFHRGFPYEYTGGIIQCRVCQEVCDDFEFLTKHALKSHPTPDLKFECAHCGKKKADLSNLGRHMLKHSKERPHKCPICLKTFKSLDQRNVHQKNIHVTENLFQCPECPKTFKCRNHLNGHRPVHNISLKFKCTECEKRFKTKRGLRSHSLCHVDAKFPCKVCGKVFKFSSGRWKHFKNLHKPPDKRKSLECSLCSRSFNYSSDLKRHLLTHTEKKPFKCQICPKEAEKEKSFRLKHRLKYHMESCHSSVTISCSVCSKIFSARDNLNSHMRSVHSNKKPHKCTICQKDFIRPYELKVHMKKIHQKCKKCNVLFEEQEQLRDHNARSHPDSE